MQIFSESITSLWNKWELRVLVLLSLLWQIILIILGNRRKYTKSAMISCSVWIIYLSADWLATVSLGNLANNNIQNKGQVLQALWAPFLLLHLGGPDTITAYSLEDNNLWLRHLLGLIVEVSIAFYIFLRSWGNDPLTFIAIPVFVSGLIKYSERTWALRAASPDQFEGSMLSSPLAQEPQDFDKIGGPNDKDLKSLHKGYFLFPLVKHLYADQSLSFAEGRQSCSLMVKEGDESKKEPPKIVDASFELVEVQLGFLFDVLYTKATIIYTKLGLVLRFISVFCIVFALVAFHIVIDSTYSRVDVAITYTLFAGAASLEIYAFVSLMLSDWTACWLTKWKNPLAKSAIAMISCCRSKLCYEKRWSGYAAQLNLVDFCLNRTCFIGASMFSNIWFNINLLLQMQSKKVEEFELKSLILEKLESKYNDYKESNFNGNFLRELLSQRGKDAAKKGDCESIHWSFEVEFDHSILLWHVATDICYHSYPGKEADPNRKASKILSDYVLYILLMRPLMLPKWIDRITHVRDTFNHAIKVFHRSSFPVRTNVEACNMLIQLHTQSQVLDSLRSEKSGKSVLLDACRLALQLQNNLGGDSHDTDNNKKKKKMNLWEMVCGVWIEMLAYAASHGDWYSHAKQLGNGGELLTHVSLLMADIGLSEHFVLGTKSVPIDRQNGWGWARTTLASPDASLLAISSSSDPRSSI